MLPHIPFGIVSCGAYISKGSIAAKGMSIEAEKDPIHKIRSELQKGMKLSKCRRCGCMKEVLERLYFLLSSLQIEGASDLLIKIRHWVEQTEPIEYPCLGCNYCFPAVAMNIFNRAFGYRSLGYAFKVEGEIWPPVPGEYFTFCEGPSCPVAVSTLGSVELADKLASLRPKELCIVGKTETENIGVEKVIKNTITNPTIKSLLLCGKDPKGHHSGKTILALWKNGVDGNMRVIGSPGKLPILRNVTRQEVETFRKKVQVVDLIGCEDERKIIGKIKELSKRLSPSCSCQGCVEEIRPMKVSSVPVIQAEELEKVEMDKAGYFVIIPQPQKGVITMEHYSYDNRLLRVIEGKDARSIYWTIIKNGWVTRLSHAAYLGKELMKAELSIKLGFRYVQDGA